MSEQMSAEDLAYEIVDDATTEIYGAIGRAEALILADRKHTIWACEDEIRNVVPPIYFKAIEEALDKLVEEAKHE